MDQLHRSPTEDSEDRGQLTSTRTLYNLSSPSTSVLNRFDLSSLDVSSIDTCTQSDPQRRQEPPVATLERTVINHHNGLDHSDNDRSSCSTTDTWRPPAFPLREIGALQSLHLNSNSEAGEPAELEREEETGLVVLGEYSSGHYNEEMIPMGQESKADTSSQGSNTTSVYTHDSIAEATTLHRLIQRAIYWLLQHNTRTYYNTGITKALYWAIRSLTSFYAIQIDLAQLHGAHLIQEPEEADWPDEPHGGENGDITDLADLPEWLHYLLMMDNLFDQNLKEYIGAKDAEGPD